MAYKEKYNMWLEDDFFDEETKNELRAIEDEEEIEDRFYRDLEFGTAGIRGKIGAGTNRMNKYTVSLATQGLASTIVNKGEKAMNMGVAIAYDVRHHSDEFAEIAARVLAANGIKVYLFDGIRPTPMLSYTVRELGTISGIVVTASHNPREYNGYKVYWEEGSQILDDIASEILEEIGKVDHFKEIELMDLNEAIEEGRIEYIGEEIDAKYNAEILNRSIREDSELDKDVRVVYTPLNGTGNKPVRRVLDDRGFDNIFVVEEQENPDPDFTTVGYPNPEDPKAFKLAEELGKKKDADILVATDPDADRIAMKVKNEKGEYIFLNGNQTGALLVNYVLSSLYEKEELPKDPAIVKSIVTGDLGKVIADKYGVSTFETLTGFKNICALPNKWDKTGEYNFVFGYEESIGYTYGSLTRDKDAVISTMIIVEMVAYYKKQGKNMLEILEAIYEEYGYYKEELKSIVLEGIEGSERILRMMEGFRKDPIDSIGDMKLERVTDYLEDDTEAGKSNVLKYELDDGSWYVVRPSGTEPKIKLYIYSKDKNEDVAQEKIDEIERVVEERLMSIK